MRESLTLRVESLFRSRPGDWIDGRDLSQIGGAYGWRTRVSDVRRNGLTIRNRQRRVTKPDGSSYVVSEYRYEPESLLEIAAAGDTLTDNRCQ